MSIISIHEDDSTNFLCKRFATLAASYFDAPESAHTPTARVPLENLYRLLEMFRNKTFSDESRGGVLALESVNAKVSSLSHNAMWQTDIEGALHKSIASTFDNGVSEEDAAQELQGSLRWLATGKESLNNDAAIGRAKRFFSELSHSL